jgi:hypothetical protein
MNKWISLWCVLLRLLSAVVLWQLISRTEHYLEAFISVGIVTVEVPSNFVIELVSDGEEPSHLVRRGFLNKQCGLPIFSEVYFVIIVFKLFFTSI